MKLDELIKIHSQLSNTLDIIETRLMEFDWQCLASNNLKILAIRAYYRKYNCSLMEAKAQVENFIDLSKKECAHSSIG